ncbi:lipopolysaccharide biosynthesis protein [Halalkalibacter akibai]|uniref:Uncharacterized protein n=1 Tax=Halalkalibacter akibai (strain ATCC 43226 / DSM 21942 / CIP 109018 / JCM 9157 / 1139) TaxID=1236973 RepID=W4QXA3_HALA3|nr:oligosaccharide flippase family protein [Halalkalibacter akibai]GAE35934.1 hypothetical protein JCM9157_3075 [Halalkalibacter akibai JCM 9157]
MRTNHSIKNITISILSQLVMVFLGFLSRKVFLDSLGIEYLGINGLLTNVLSMLALVEGGIGLSITYYLYKPLAENDKKKIIALVQLFKKAYFILSIVILVLSICLYPLLGTVMNESDTIKFVSVIYFLFIAKNMVSYLNAHKWSLINADQRGYVLEKVNIIFQVSTNIAKIILLIKTQNYILYLALELCLYIIQNLINGHIVNKRYSYIKTKKKYTIDNDTKAGLVKNVKALFYHNIGGFLVFGTDNILISSFISIATVGLYSNYTMITQQLSSLVNPLLAGIGASVGNLIATESKEKNYSIFKVSYLMNFWIYSIAVIFLYNLLEPFISWWLGQQFLLDKLVFIIILINFYLTGMRTAIATFKNKAGLFVQDKYAPLIEGGVNLVASLILVKYLGLAGILLGTTISTIATIFWTQPLIVYKNIFVKPVWSYFLRYVFYLVLTLIVCYITTLICEVLIKHNGFIDLVFKGLISISIPSIIYLLIFYRSDEFKYLYKFITSRFKIKLKSTNQRAG